MGYFKHQSSSFKIYIWNHNTRVKTNNIYSDAFKFHKCERQGCILSHLLFNKYSEHKIMNNVLDGWKGGVAAVDALRYLRKNYCFNLSFNPKL